jgi:uncharacterized protein DUF4157
MKSGPGHQQRPSVAPGSVIQRKCACGSAKIPADKECDECKSRRVQTNLTISAPGDAFELEADRIADHIVSSSHSFGTLSSRVPVQRVARRRDDFGSRAPLGVGEAVAAPSMPVDPNLRRDMEKRFGHDFSRVRIHVDSAAADSARELRADAYTIGEHIVFASGQYAPATKEGRRLIAHELTHVVQQSGAAAATADAASATVFRQASDKRRCLNDPDWRRIDAKPKEIWSPANDALERAYKDDHAGHAVLTGSQFEYGGKPGSSGIQLPKDAPNKKSCDRLLSNFIGVSRQLAPDVMDCTDRVFYEIKTTQYAGSGAKQLLDYYKIANQFASQEGERPWKFEYASWYPPRILKLDNTRRVCTEGTDYRLSGTPGLIVYEVQDHKDRKNKQEEEQQADEKKKAQDAAAAALLRKKLKAVKELIDQLEREVDMSEGDHRTQRNLINDPSYAGFWGFWTNELFSQQPPLLMIWDEAYLSIERARTQLRAGNPKKAFEHFVKGRRSYIKSLKRYLAWKNKLPGAASQMKTAIAVGAVLAVAAFVAPTVVAEAVEASSATAGTAANLAAAQEAVAQASLRIAAGEAEIAAIEASITEYEIVTAAELEAEQVVLEMLHF